MIFQRPIFGGRTTSSVVFYAFVDVEKWPFVGQMHDPARKIKQGDPVVVFYRLLDPNQSVVLDGYDFTLGTP